VRMRCSIVVISSIAPSTVCVKAMPSLGSLHCEDEICAASLSVCPVS